MHKLFEVSKSLLYSELRCFGIYALPVGFAVETGGCVPPDECCRNGGSFATKCAKVNDGFLDSREELICCAVVFSVNVSTVSKLLFAEMR